MSPVAGQKICRLAAGSEANHPARGLRRERLSDAVTFDASSTGASVQLPPNWLGTVQVDPRSVSDSQSTEVVAEQERSGLDRQVAEALAEAFPSALTVPSGTSS